jgi:hypothetical protein
MPRIITSAQLSLAVGLAVTAGVLGFMVGGSESPVVSTVIPAAFALLIPAFGLIKGRASSSPNEPEHNAEQGHQTARVSPHMMFLVGIMLTVFSGSYVLGALVGIRFREALPSRSLGLPWATKEQQPPVDEALQWLVVQSRLLEYGYNLKDVRTLYDAYHSANPTQHVAFANPDGKSLNFALERNLLNNVPEPSEAVQKAFSGGTMLTSFRSNSHRSE